MPNINAAILAGGGSKRFGQDKATLKYGNTTLLERIFYELSTDVKKCWIVGRKYKELNLTKNCFIDDIVTNAGPIGGLYTALNISKNPILLTSCDMPFLIREHVNFLLNQYDPTVAATIAVSDKGIEPLFGIYRRQIIPIITMLIDSGEYALYRIFDHVQVKFVDFEKAGYISDLFFNINTLSDYKKALYLRSEFLSKNNINDSGGKNGKVR